MSLPEPKACTACASCTRVGNVYVCTLPPQCFDLRDPDTDERIEPQGEWLGVDCDRARRMGELCGPAGTLWVPRTP